VISQEEVEDLLSNDRWLAMSIEGSSRLGRRNTEDDVLTSLKQGVSFLLAGTSRGYLAILDPRTGEVVCSVHGETGIRGEESGVSQGGVIEEGAGLDEDSAIRIIACNCKKNQIATAGRGELTPTVIISSTTTFGGYENFFPVLETK